MIPGHATAQATAAYASAHPAARGHYRSWQNLTVPSLGMGSYLGRTDAKARADYEAAALACLDGGVNLLDTAANYRDQASERDLGRAIARYVAAGGDRAGIVVVTKAGFVHGDCDQRDARSWLQAEYIDAGILDASDVAAGHCLKPAFLLHQLARSRRNLALECIDVMLLHNVEHPLEEGLDRPAFLARVTEAFAALERACDKGHLRAYGVATWNGLRTPEGEPGHLDLALLLEAAAAARFRVGPGTHHFGAIELPVNLVMAEAALVPTQSARSGAQTPLDAAKVHGLLVLASASLMQMRVRGRVPAEYAQAFGTRGDAATCLQFTRSVPGVTTALVGMGSPVHARENCAFATATAPAPGIVRTLLGTGSVHGW